MTGATAKPKVSVPEPWMCQVPGCTHGPEGGPYQTQRHRSRMAHLEEMQLHMCCLHPGMLQSTRAAAGASAPPAPAPVVFLDPKSCEFPGCTWSTPAGQFVAISERQAELQLHITMKHSGGSGTGGGATRGKCQTQTKVDRPNLKAKTSATEWILWLNAWQRYLEETELSGHSAVTQLWECLSSETAIRLIQAGFGQEKSVRERIFYFL